MNIAQLKGLSWFAALVAGAGLGWYVWDFAQSREEMQRSPNARISEVLNNIPPPAAKEDRLVDYQRLLGGVVKLDWTGQPPPEPIVVSDGPTGPEPPPPKTPVSDLLRVVYIQVDTALPRRSLAMVSFKNAQLAAAAGDYAPLRVDDRLPADFSDVRVVEINPNAVVFGFDEEGREHERLGPVEFSSTTTIVMVGEGGARLPVAYAFQDATPEYVVRTWNEDTIEIRPGEFRVGTRDAELIGEGWSEVLANDVRHSRWRNPRSGRYEGIYVSDIKYGSVAAKFGIKSGDIIKSINGHAVTSSQEAISFVKQEVKDKVIEKWYVVVESLGKDHTIVITTPK